MATRSNKPRKVLTYGTFDLFHKGHLNLLQNSAAFGDELIVGVSTDEFNLEKNKRAIIPYRQRMSIVANIKCVDSIFPEYSWEQKIDDIIRHQIDTLIMGADWKGKFDFLNPYCEVVYLHRTEGISTTEIRSRIMNESSCGMYNCLNEEQRKRVDEKVQTILNDRNNNEDHLNLFELRDKVAKGMYNLLKG